MKCICQRKGSTLKLAHFAKQKGHEKSSVTAGQKINQVYIITRRNS